MSIIIKGVKKPNNGYTMGILLYPNGDAFILSNEIPVKICKAIELPPHGRLIDESEVMHRLGITDMDCTKCAWGNHGFCGRGGDFNDACEAIEEATTIIEAEEELDFSGMADENDSDLDFSGLDSIGAEGNDGTT